MVNAFAVAGTPDEARERIEELWRTADSMTLVPPLFSALDKTRLRHTRKRPPTLSFEYSRGSSNIELFAKDFGEQSLRGLEAIIKAHADRSYPCLESALLPNLCTVLTDLCQK
jgi:hypothetical protein